MVTPTSARDLARASARADLRAAAEAYLTLVTAVPDDAWERPGLGVWTVRELVGHTCRALSTIEDYLAPPPPGTAGAADGEPTLSDAVAYFRTGGDLGLTNSEGVAERGRAAGRELGPRPPDTLTEVTTRVLALLDQAPDDVLTSSRLGSIRLVDYLPTRTFELVVHGLDLASALSIGWDVPRGPLESSLALASGLAAERGLGPQVLLALTGRRPLPEGFCVF